MGAAGEMVGQRVLVVEDDRAVRRVLEELLTRDGFCVTAVGAGLDVLPAVRSGCPGVVLLDLGLPDVNGFDLLRELRAVHDVPVIVLSGRADEADRVLALELGADDYVVKPFLNRELVARVRARLRRPPVRRDPGGAVAVAHGGLEVDTRSREVVLDGQAVPLTAKEFDLLEFLMTSPRQVFSRSQLLHAVWNSSGEWQTDATVTEHIHRLRQKVGGDRIATVRGVGYRYEPLEVR